MIDVTEEYLKSISGLPPKGAKMIDVTEEYTGTPSLPEDSWLKTFTKPIPAAAGSLVRGAGGLVQMAEEIVPEKHIPSFGLGKGIASLGKTAQEYWRPKVAPGSAKGYVSGAIESVAQNTPIYVGSLPFGPAAPAVALSLMGATAAGEKYSELEDKGFSPTRKRIVAGLTGAAEAIGEWPAAKIVLSPGKTLVKRALQSYLPDLAGEEITTLLRFGIDKGLVDPSMPLKDIPRQMWDTLIVTSIAGPLQAGLIHPLANRYGKETKEPTVDLSKLEEDAPVVTPPPLPPPTERRADYGRREEIQKLIDAGDVEGAHKAIYEDPLTGLLNAKAWKEAEQKAPGKVIASMDISGLKWINDNFGHPAGDTLLKTMAEEIKTAGIEGFRKGGDEITGIFESQQQADELLNKAQKALANKKIEVTTPDGKKHTYTGWRLDYGTGKDFDTADKALYTGRAEQVAAGFRGKSGEKPFSVVEAIPEGFKADSIPHEGVKVQPPARRKAKAQADTEISITDFVRKYGGLSTEKEA